MTYLTRVIGRSEIMKPGYWIGIAPLIGAVIGYAVFHLTGWSFATVISSAIGFAIGIAIYSTLKDKSKINNVH